jgi:small subunit ribosomal protein S5
MAEFLDGSGGIESTTVGVFRTAATVKGGRRFSFSSLVVVGDRNGRVGAGYGKANQVPPAIEKAQKIAKRNMRSYPMQGRTIPHEVEGRFGACRVRLVPASPGTGVIAGASVRAVLEMFGLQDCLTKSYGSNNSKNVVKATIDGLSRLRGKDDVERLRGVGVGTTDVEEMIVRGTSFMPSVEVAADPDAADAEPTEPTEPANAAEPTSEAAKEAPAEAPAENAAPSDDDTPKESPTE